MEKGEEVHLCETQGFWLRKSDRRVRQRQMTVN